MPPSLLSSGPIDSVVAIPGLVAAATGTRVLLVDSQGRRLGTLGSRATTTDAAAPMGTPLTLTPPELMDLHGIPEELRDDPAIQDFIADEAPTVGRGDRAGVVVNAVASAPQLAAARDVILALVDDTLLALHAGPRVERRGRPGPLDGLAASPDGSIVAGMRGRTVVISQDGGRTFDRRETMPVPPLAMSVTDHGVVMLATEVGLIALPATADSTSSTDDGSIPGGIAPDLPPAPRALLARSRWAGLLPRLSILVDVRESLGLNETGAGDAERDYRVLALATFPLDVRPDVAGIRRLEIARARLLGRTGQTRGQP